MCNDKNHNTTDQQSKSLVYVIFVLFWHVQIVSNSLHSLCMGSPPGVSSLVVLIDKLLLSALNTSLVCNDPGVYHSSSTKY